MKNKGIYFSRLIPQLFNTIIKKLTLLEKPKKGITPDEYIYIDVFQEIKYD